MKKINLIAAVFALALFAGIFWFLSSHKAPGSSTGAPSEVQWPVVEAVPAPALGQTYTNKAYKFSVQMPAGFKASELANDAGGKTILLQDGSGQGIQIYVTPYPEDTHTLTADDVRSSIPDMHITDAQDVPVGTSYKGVAFRSDNEAFGSDSREVWFVFRSNLYQISTYSRFDPLLKAMFGTWKFE